MNWFAWKLRRLSFGIQIFWQDLFRCPARYPGCCDESHRCYHNRFHSGNHHAAWVPVEGWR